MTRRRSDRRSFVLVTILVISGCALLVTTGLLFVAQAQAASLRGGAELAQSRSLMRSGLLAIVSVFDGQRERVLEGRLPQVDTQYTLYEAGDRLGVVRLLPVTSDGEPLAPESGKLDLNGASAEALEATGLIDAHLAAAIVTRREIEGPFESIGP